MSQQTTAKKLYDVLTVRNFEDLKALDSRTSRPPVNDQGQPDVSQADMFSFDWTAQSGRDYGTVVILLTADSELELYFGDNLGRGMEPEDKQDWYDFLLQIKQFATRNFLGFKPQNINRLKFSLAGQAAINEGLFENWRGTATTSWNGNTTEARIMVRHKRRLGENDARYRYIESVFIETADGERYRLPFVKLSGAKAMLEHVRHGGRPYDSRGQHIASMVEELNVLSRFRRAVRGQVLEGVSASLVEQTSSYYESLGRQLNRLHTSRGYQSYFEAWSPAEVSDQDIMVEDLRSMFMEQSLDTRIEAALPVLARIHQGKNMKEVTVFEQWVNGLVEGTWALPSTPEKQQQLIELMSQDLPVGADATNAAQQLYSLIGDDDLFDMLSNLADSNADADARPDVAYWMSEHLDIPVIAAVYEKVPADVKPEAFMPPAQDPAVTEQQHDTADHDADLDSILRNAGVPVKPKAAPDYQTGVTESAMSEVYSTLSDIAETNDLDELDFLMRDSGPAGRYVQNIAAKLAAQHNLDATDDHDQMLQLVMDQIQQQVSESVTEARMPLEGHPYHNKSDAELRYIMKDAGEAAKAMRDRAPAAESKYLDQVNDAATVLWYRKRQQGMAEGIHPMISAGWNDKAMADGKYRIGGPAGKILHDMGAANPVGPVQKQIWDIIRSGKEWGGPESKNLLGKDVKYYDYYSMMNSAWNKSQKANVTQGMAEGLGGEIAGGVVGGLVGGAAGSQLGPIGGVIGSAVGGSVGSAIGGRYQDGKPLKEKQQLDEIAPLLAVGARLFMAAAPKIAQIVSKAGRAGAQGAGRASRAGAEIAARNAGQIGLGAAAYEIGSSVADIAKEITAEVGTAIDEKTVFELAMLAFKYAIPAGIVLAVLYGGKKAIDSLFSDSSSQKTTSEKTQGVAEVQGCNMSESGTMCSEHGLVECGMSEYDNSTPAYHQEQDPIEGLKSLLGRLRT